MEWEGQPSAAPMDAVRATRHHSCTAVPAHAEWDSGEGERRSGSEHEMGADHTLCMVCMVCTHHPNYTFTVTTPCRWHVDRQRGRKRRERGGAAHSCPLPSPHIQQAHTTTPHLLSFLSLPPSLSLVHTHNTHSHHHLHITAPPTQPTSHTRPKPHPMHMPVHRGNAAAAQQQHPHYSRSSPPPAAHVLLHLHATPVNTSSKWYMCE